MNDRIVLDPQVCHGKPVIRGTRVPVARVIGYLAGGMSFDDVQKDFDLAPEDVRRLELCGGIVESGTTPSSPGLINHYAIAEPGRVRLRPA